MGEDSHGAGAAAPQGGCVAQKLALEQGLEVFATPWRVFVICWRASPLHGQQVQLEHRTEPSTNPGDGDNLAQERLVSPKVGHGELALLLCYETVLGCQDVTSEESFSLCVLGRAGLCVGPGAVGRCGL